ncbi:MAG: DUF4345 family protein [Sneathiella sp.]|nr:DUF4345 family protein [Sneathiella sp.]
MHRSSITFLTLRVVLALIGIAIIFLGLNVGLGGIRTLGWQGPLDFLAVVDTSVFNAQDNHVRFLGGVWLGVGLLFFTSAFAFSNFKAILLALCMLIFVGGLSRFSVMEASVIFSASIAPSLFAELILFPLLGLWIARTASAKA